MTHSADNYSVDRDLSHQFCAELRRIGCEDPSYWNYADVKSGSNPYAYFQYPAMMVPRMQGDIIDAVKKVFTQTTQTFDPFAGSGTVLVESLKRGLCTVATDINPMALLLCKVKAQPFRVSAVEDALRDVLKTSGCDADSSVEIRYSNRDKWFSPDALVELSRVFRAITNICDLEIRRFLWVAFAEAVRITSNSRTSTYKLHIRGDKDLNSRSVGVRDRIASTMIRVSDLYKSNFKRLSAAGCLVDNGYSGNAIVLNHDIRLPLGSHRADALISSPPYGDNHTTVAYGQHSFLPLCWIPTEDISRSVNPSLLANTHAIDSASLGGRAQREGVMNTVIEDRSDALAALMVNSTIAPVARKRLAGFFFDLDQSLANALDVLRPRSPIVLTVGNRCVCGVRIPTDKIVQEFLLSRRCEMIDSQLRVIPVKRAACRNNNSATMLMETMIVMRGPSSSRPV